MSNLRISAEKGDGRATQCETDEVGNRGITALVNGNYLVTSDQWNDVGAVTFGNGKTGIAGAVSAANSLIGVPRNDAIDPGSHVTALSNGNYVVASYNWSDSGLLEIGAVTWSNGAVGVTGLVSPRNSLVGATSGDKVGRFVEALPDGNYVVTSPSWTRDAMTSAGAVTLLNGNFRFVGTIHSWNSVLGGMAYGGLEMVHAYDPMRKQLAVGRVAENRVSLFTMDQLFADSFD